MVIKTCNVTGCKEDPIRIVGRKGTWIRYCEKHFKEYYDRLTTD